MTDLEIVRLCASAMGIAIHETTMNRPEHTLRLQGFNSNSYWPLTDDAQCFALVKTFRLLISSEVNGNYWLVEGADQGWEDADLNRAICLCVANMQKAKG